MLGWRRTPTSERCCLLSAGADPLLLNGDSQSAFFYYAASGLLVTMRICHCIDRVTPVDLIARHLPIIVQYCPARAYGQSPNSSRISKNIRMHWVEGLSCCSLLSLEKNFCACRFQSLELVCNSSTYIFDKPCFDAGTYLHLPKCQYFFLFSGNCFFRIGALVEKKDTFDFLRGLFVRSSKGPTFASLLFLPTNYTRQKR